MVALGAVAGGVLVSPRPRGPGAAWAARLTVRGCLGLCCDQRLELHVVDAEVGIEDAVPHLRTAKWRDALIYLKVHVGRSVMHVV